MQKNQATYESSARQFASLNTVQMQQHDHDPTHQTAQTQYDGDDATTLRYCPDSVTLLLLLCLIRKVPGLVVVDLEKNTGTKYAVTISGGRQRHNASTLESLSGVAASSHKKQ